MLTEGGDGSGGVNGKEGDGDNLPNPVKRVSFDSAESGGGVDDFSADFAARNDGGNRGGGGDRRFDRAVHGSPCLHRRRQQQQLRPSRFVEEEEEEREGRRARRGGERVRTAAQGQRPRARAPSA